MKVSTPQGRFDEEAKKVSGRKICQVTADGKHLFYHWTRGELAHVHLGLYGKFRVHKNPAPEPRGAVRVRMIGRERSFDLNVPNRCELIDQQAYTQLRARLGEDPLHSGACADTVWDRCNKSRAPIGSLLLNQSVIAGVGNIYRTEVLFLARIHPELPANHLDRKQFDELWERTKTLMKIGVKYNQIITLGREQRDRPLSRLAASERVNIYKRDDCPRCGSGVKSWELGGRKMYACCNCQKK
ncbi:MAG: Fpg/Nei family DNA glycosylase [Rubripirellula sp.]|nr:Fpg/Nei family DNA glycosylase [Rubripirellula sp.]